MGTSTAGRERRDRDPGLQLKPHSRTIHHCSAPSLPGDLSESRTRVLGKPFCAFPHCIPKHTRRARPNALLHRNEAKRERNEQQQQRLREAKQRRQWAVREKAEPKPKLKRGRAKKNQQHANCLDFLMISLLLYNFCYYTKLPAIENNLFPRPQSCIA